MLIHWLVWYCRCIRNRYRQNRTMESVHNGTWNGKYLMMGDESWVIQSHDGNGELILNGRHGRRRRRRRRRGEIVAVAGRVVRLFQSVFGAEAAEDHRKVGQTVEQSEHHHSEKQLSIRMIIIDIVSRQTQKKSSCKSDLMHLGQSQSHSIQYLIISRPKCWIESVDMDIGWVDWEKMQAMTWWMDEIGLNPSPTLKKVVKMWESVLERRMKARKVEKPPFHTAGPIRASVTLARANNNQSSD